MRTGFLSYWYGCCNYQENQSMITIVSPKCMLICFVSFLLVSCSPAIAPVKSPVPAKNIPENVMEKDILYHVNAYRKTLKKPALSLLPPASVEAFNHSKNMATGKTGFGHDGFSERVDRIKQSAGWISASAENVASGKLTAKEVVKGWINSPGHKKNIEGNYVFTGIGVFTDKKGVTFFTQIFLRN